MKLFKSVLSVSLIFIICYSCSNNKSDKEESKYFMIELPFQYEGYINVVLTGDNKYPLLNKKGLYLSVNPDSSGTVLVGDRFAEWMETLQPSFLDDKTRASAPIFKSGGDSSRVFNIKLIDLQNSKKYKCFRAFVTKEMLPNSDTSSLPEKKKLKAYQVDKLESL